MGSLLHFPSQKPSWSPMEINAVHQAVLKALAEAEEFHRLANELSVRDRARVLKRLQTTYVDDIYKPWGGLFPHPMERL